MQKTTPSQPVRPQPATPERRGPTPLDPRDYKAVGGGKLLREPSPKGTWA